MNNAITGASGRPGCEHSLGTGKSLPDWRSDSEPHQKGVLSLASAFRSPSAAASAPGTAPSPDVSPGLSPWGGGGGWPWGTAYRVLTAGPELHTGPCTGVRDKPCPLSSACAASPISLTTHSC